MVSLSGSDKPASATAGWFGPEDRPRFGWVHRPATTAATRALVLVPPFGNEALCTQRSLRALAEAAAAAGMLVLRFDLDGTGESAGGDLDPDRLDAWLVSVADACDLARAQGVHDLVLAGFRLGASLAALAAETRDDIAGLVAINAVVSGRKWLREGRALQMAMGLTPDPNPPETPLLELAGFPLTEQTRTRLSSLDLASRDRRPAPVVLLIERDDIPDDAGWRDHLVALDCRVDSQRLPGYADMMQAPHLSLIPEVMIENAVRWAAACPMLAMVPPPAIKSTLNDTVDMPTRHGLMRNRAVHLGSGLFGIHSHPLENEAPRALVLLNAGGISRIGPNRLFVEMAARRVAAGEQVLRVDLSGVGDSATRIAGVSERIYHRLTEDDTAAIIEWLRNHGSERIAVGGLCSGGYHALKAALAGQDVQTVLMINPLTFDYHPDEDPYSNLHRDSQRHSERIRSGAAWLRLLRGEVALGRALHVLAWRVYDSLHARLLNLARSLHLPVRNDLGSQLQSLAVQGVEVHYVFAGEEPAPAMLGSLAGNALPRLLGAGQTTIQTLDGADHTFTSRWTHDWLLDARERVLDRRCQ